VTSVATESQLSHQSGEARRTPHASRGVSRPPGQWDGAFGSGRVGLAEQPGTLACGAASGAPRGVTLTRPDETGTWRLVQDQDQVQVELIKEVVRRVLGGEPLRAIAHDLTARSELTPRDRFAESQGREVKGYEWHSSGLKRALTSQTLLEYAVAREPLTDAQSRIQRNTKGKKVFGPEKPVRNDDGSPVVRAKPILKREVFDRLAVELARRENRKEPTKRSTGLLLRVVHCGVCGRPAYRQKGGPGRKPRYRCKSVQDGATCGPNPSIPLEYADEAVERIIVGLLGTSEQLERVWDSGSDHSAEAAEVDARLTDLTGQLGLGLFRQGTPQRAELDRQIEMLAARQAELFSQAVKPAGWTWQPTGEKFADWWESQDVTGRNVWLRQMNIRLEFANGQLHLDLGDLFALTEQMLPSGPVADWQKIPNTMSDSGVRGVTQGVDGSLVFEGPGGEV
jgi:site-specific DNA recombinase